MSNEPMGVWRQRYPEIRLKLRDTCGRLGRGEGFIVWLTSQFSYWWHHTWFTYWRKKDSDGTTYYRQCFRFARAERFKSKEQS